MFEYKCEHCGKVCFAQYKSQRKRFCSHQCANESRWKKIPKKQTTIICKTCGKEFFVKSYDIRLKRKGILYCSKQCAAQGSKTGETKVCPVCGIHFYTTRRKFCSPKCAQTNKSLTANHKTFMENGYVCEYQKGSTKTGTVKQHRKIMEELLGRKLSCDEVVHHKNGIKTDNRVENLVVMDRSAHSKLHRMMEKTGGLKE